MILKEFDADNFHIIIYEPEVSKPQKISFETKSEKATIADFANILYKHIVLPESVFKLLTSSLIHFSVKTPNNEFCFTDHHGLYSVKHPEIILCRVASNILI